MAAKQQRRVPSLADRVRGCLLAGACGDALGAPVEFLDLDRIRERYGCAGIRDFDEAYGRVGAITDDTQMTLFTAEGLIRAAVRQSLKGICHVPSVVHHGYLRWLATQGRKPEKCNFEPPLDGWLIGVEALWSRRAPGNTCLGALADTRVLGDVASNDSKGCGGVMRVAPVGFVYAHQGGADAAFDLGCDLARLTHGHPTGYLSAGYLAALIALLAQGTVLDEALDRVSAILVRFPAGEEVARAVDTARDAAAHPAAAERLVALGQGWVAEEALAMSIYCAIATETVEETIMLAVNHGGDSDSTGAIAGNIVGTLLGAAAIPKPWLDRLELRRTIETLAADLASLFTGTGLDAEALAPRYPGS